MQYSTVFSVSEYSAFVLYRHESILKFLSIDTIRVSDMYSFSMFEVD